MTPDYLAGFEAGAQDHDEANVSCWCAPTVECPTCGLGPLCKDDDHVKVIIHKEPD